MNKTLTIISLVLFSFSAALAQKNLYGTVTNSVTGSAVEEAVIFIASTTKITKTNSKGLYFLENMPQGNAQIVVYQSGFEPLIKSPEIDNEGKLKMDFSLIPLVKSNDADAGPVSEKKQKRYLKKFSEGLIGYSKNANKCLISNPEVLVFEEGNNGILKAIATDLIKIDNDALGYTVNFWLESFYLESGSLPSVSGIGFYEEKVPEDVKDIERWERNRIKNYFGSPQHFFKSLANNSLREEGYEIRKATVANQNQFIDLKSCERAEFFESDEETDEKTLTVSGHLKVIYKNEKDDISQKLEGLGLGITHLIKPASNYHASSAPFPANNTRENQISYLFANNKKIELDEEGQPKSAKNIVFGGYWDYKGLANTIPVDFIPVSEKESTESEYASFNQPIASVQPKNGFDLNNSLVRSEYILESGLPKNARPSIDNPNFVRSAQARDFLTDDDLVIGVALNDVAKAYPVKIMNLHEVVNDDFDGTTVAITYSPLCRSAMAFMRDIKSGEKSFASSGLLFNNGILLYDRESQSLWSQIMARAVTGTESGNPLELIPSVITTFKNWRKLHPGSKIMSLNTGFQMDYTSSPYREYARTQEVKFHVTRSSDNLPNKELVLGVQIGFRTKAYPFSELRKTDGTLEDSFNGRQFTIHYDDASSSAWVTDRRGERLAGTSMYWFAWYAFHPETVVFWNDERG